MFIYYVVKIPLLLLWLYFKRDSLVKDIGRVRQRGLGDASISCIHLHVKKVGAKRVSWKSWFSLNVDCL
jgi:hypothetical protein